MIEDINSGINIKYVKLEEVQRRITWRTEFEHSTPRHQSNLFDSGMETERTSNNKEHHPYKVLIAHRHNTVTIQVAAERIRATTTALDAKRIDDTVKNRSKDTEKVDFVSNIIEDKFSLMEPFREKIKKGDS